MAEVTAKKSLQAIVKERVRSNKCLVCDGPCERRGLCQRHYATFLRQLRERPRDERVAYEEALIREGKILAIQQMRELKRDDPFAIANS